MPSLRMDLIRTLSSAGSEHCGHQLAAQLFRCSLLLYVLLYYLSSLDLAELALEFPSRLHWSHCDDEPESSK
jgi:hypothetical protein